METSKANSWDGQALATKKTSVLLWREEQAAEGLDLLTSCCLALNLEVKALDRCSEELDITPHVQTEPAILMIPAMQREGLGVKLAQEAISLRIPAAVALYSQQVPTKEYLCLAFQAGIDEVISLKSNMDLLHVQISRLCCNLGQRVKMLADNSALQWQVCDLTHQCERLRRDNARHQKRLLALGYTADRLATAELEPAKNHPRLLIVASDRYQAAKAEGQARPLGFDVYTVPDGETALSDLAQYPPRIILCDSELPDMEVVAFARAARTVLRDSPTCIIAWSSDADAEDRLVSPQTGIDDFVLKTADNESAPVLTCALLGGL